MNNKIIFLLVSIVLSVFLLGCKSANVVENTSVTNNPIDDSEIFINSEADEISSNEFVSNEYPSEQINELEEKTIYFISDISMKNVSKGDLIYLGNYEQDNNLENGKEPIVWEVLYLDGNQLLLQSRDILDFKEVDTIDDFNSYQFTWETCTLRSWLNNEFFNEAFDSSEQTLIIDSYVENLDNKYMSGQGGNDTMDKVYLLSNEEIMDYYGYDYWYNISGYCQNVIKEPTQYVQAMGGTGLLWSELPDDLKNKNYTEDLVGKRALYYWTRSVGGTDSCCHVDWNGYYGEDCCKLLPIEKMGVCPVVRVEIN